MSYDAKGLDLKDVEAIAKSRAARTIPNNIKWWIYGGMFLCLGGLVYSWFFKGGWYGFGVVVIGAAITWYGSSINDKRKKQIYQELKESWKVEDTK